MRLQLLIVCAAFASTPFVRAQTVPQKTICLARFSGAEAVNWNLRPSILRELTQKMFDQNLKFSAVELDAKDDKHSATEAEEKKCTFVVYSQIDRKTGDVNSMMNPSIYQRGTANVDSTTGSSTLRYDLKIKDANRKKVAGDKIDVELRPGYGSKDYEEQGRVLVNSATTKIIAAVTK